MSGLLAAFGTRHLTGDPSVWLPYARNHFTVPAELVTVGDETAWIRLTDSRWEGCRVRIWADRVVISGETATVTLRGADQPLAVTDGRYTMFVTARALWEDRQNPVPAASPFVVVPTWRPGFDNSVIVDQADVTEAPSGRAWRIAFTRSRWEGLWFTVPGFCVTWLGETEARVKLLRSDDMIRVHGGAQRLTVPAREVWADRISPLAEAGPSLAVEPTVWLRLPVAACHLRWVRTKKGVARVLRFPRYADRWAGASVWLSPGFVDGDTLRMPQDRTVRVRTLDGEVITVPARELFDAVEEWAHTMPAATRGVQTRDPELLPPVGEVVIPDDLLDI